MAGLLDIKDTDLDLELLHRTTEDIFSLPELQKKLSSGKKLRIKYGVDVTAPFMHLGHAVNLWMMRHLQDHGHVVVFLVGDFTTRIGDPTGKSETRPIIPQEEIDKNAEEYIKQVGKILRTDPEVFEVRRNSEWFDAMSVSKYLSLMSLVTHSRLISRDMFQKRIEENKEIYMHEMIYPLLQGYDSFELESDLTIVGSDQLFNEMMGRFYQEKLGQETQVVITSRITQGLCGTAKQSKSLGNYIAITDEPREKFGKVMSIADRLIIDYFEVYTTVPLAEVADIKKAIEAGENPMQYKKLLASKIVERYHGEKVAKEELDWFNNVFSAKNTPDDMPEIIVPADETDAIAIVSLCDPETSKSQIKRLLDQGAIKLNDEKLGLDDVVQFEDGATLKVGKRKWFKLNKAT